MSDFFRILAVFLLVLGNAIFVAAEYALVTARRARLEQRAERGSRAARTAIHLLDDPVRFISTTQVAITAFGVLLGAIGEPLLSRYFDSLPRGLAFALAFVILTYLSVVLGELVPKSISLQKAEAMAVVLALPLDFLGRVLHPLVWLLQASANTVTRLFGITPAAAGFMAHSREDIRRTVAEAEDTGVIEEAEEEMLHRVFDFAGKEAHEVMVPRPQVVALSIDLPPAECLQAVMDSPYTRYPVYRGSLDEIVGILHLRDLFLAVRERGIDEVGIEQLLRKPYFVPETKDLGALLAEFRRLNHHLAIVVDEYGAMQGIVTLEDLLEEIVGDIEDEFDLPDESVVELGDGKVEIHGTFPIDDFNERFGQALPVEDYHTLAGFVFGALGRAPEEGDEVAYDGLRFHVRKVDGTRIERLEVQLTEPESEPKPDPAQVS